MWKISQAGKASIVPSMHKRPGPASCFADLPYRCGGLLPDPPLFPGTDFGTCLAEGYLPRSGVSYACLRKKCRVCSGQFGPTTNVAQPHQVMSISLQIAHPNKIVAGGVYAH